MQSLEKLQLCVANRIMGAIMRCTGLVAKIIQQYLRRRVMRRSGVGTAGREIARRLTD